GGRTGLAVAAALVAGLVVPVVANAKDSVLVLGNDRIERRWRVTDDGVVTTALIDKATGRSWAGPASSDFSLTVDGVPVTSSGGWQRVETAVGQGVIAFRFTSTLLELDRTYTL